MIERVGYAEIVQMLTCAVERIRDKHKMLGELDSHGGDGDHGATMLRAMEGLNKAVQEDSSGEIKQMLYNAAHSHTVTDFDRLGHSCELVYLSLYD